MTAKELYAKLQGNDLTNHEKSFKTAKECEIKPKRGRPKKVVNGKQTVV